MRGRRDRSNLQGRLLVLAPRPLLNNASYVIMIASAKSIDAEGGVAVVYLVAIGPGLSREGVGAVLVRSRSIREAPLDSRSQLWSAASCSPVWAAEAPPRAKVALTSFQSALGEATVLALAARHDEGCVSAWSSGPRDAGIGATAGSGCSRGRCGFSMAACQSVAALSLQKYVCGFQTKRRPRRRDPAEAAGSRSLSRTRVRAGALADDGGPVPRLLLGVRAAVGREGRRWAFASAHIESTGKTFRATRTGYSKSAFSCRGRRDRSSRRRRPMLGCGPRDRPPGGVSLPLRRRRGDAVLVRVVNFGDVRAGRVTRRRRSTSAIDATGCGVALI